jgi:dolichol-phosphate mannosyltransferase
MPQPKTRPLVSIIIPCYNEAPGIVLCMDRLKAMTQALSAYDFEFIFVDDGSRDDTPVLLEKAAEDDVRVKVLILGRNYGQQRATTAGLDHASGDYTILMDADMQDPPEVIPQILERLDAGYDVVHTVRNSRTSDTAGKRLSAFLFYTIMRRWALPELVENAGDFKGFNRAVREAMGQYRERVRFLRGILATIGFRQCTLPYTRAVRHAGKSKFGILQMSRFARDAIISYSAFPMRLGMLLGVIMTLLAAIALAVFLFRPSTAWEPLLLASMAACTGIILVFIGLLGEYLRILMLEVKQRPLYLVKARKNLSAPSTWQAQDETRTVARF